MNIYAASVHCTYYSIVWINVFDCIHMNMIQMQLTLPALFSALLWGFFFLFRHKKLWPSCLCLFTTTTSAHSHHVHTGYQLKHNCSKENASIPYEIIVMTALTVNHYLNLQWKMCVSIDFYCEITTFYRFYLHFVFLLVISVKMPYFPFSAVNFFLFILLLHTRNHYTSEWIFFKIEKKTKF